jgi:hypothetical protein
VLTVPYFMIAAMAAAQTDCVAAIRDRVAGLYIRLLPLKRVAAAFPLPRLTTVMMWHARTEAAMTFFPAPGSGSGPRLRASAGAGRRRE